MKIQTPRTFLVPEWMNYLFNSRLNYIAITYCHTVVFADQFFDHIYCFIFFFLKRKASETLKYPC